MDLHRDKQSHPANSLRNTCQEEPVIVVMGVTGSGKSSFISQLMGEDIGIGHDLTSHTTDIQEYRCSFQDGRTVRLVDTPGFNDTSRSDIEILKSIVMFLVEVYENNVNLAGIIYLHRITDVRMPGSALTNLNMFQRLCGDNSLSNIFFVTTMWDNLKKAGIGEEVGQERENELKTTDKFWGRMVGGGSRVLQHHGDTKSARCIVEECLKEPGRVVLEIQRELVEQKKLLKDTGVGQLLLEQLQLKEQREEQDLVDSQLEFKEAVETGDNEQVAILQTQIQEQKNTIAASISEQNQLNLDRKQLVTDLIQRHKQRELLASPSIREYRVQEGSIGLLPYQPEFPALRGETGRLRDYHDQEQPNLNLNQHCVVQRQQWEGMHSSSMLAPLEPGLPAPYPQCLNNDSDRTSRTYGYHREHCEMCNCQKRRAKQDRETPLSYPLFSFGPLEVRYNTRRSA